MTELSLRTRVIVWGLSGGFCAFPGCRLQLVLQEGGGHAALIGEIAHIVAESADGPRGESALNASQRSQPTNLVLLCANHHKEIDDLPDSYAVDVLIAIKRDHERWVRELGREPQDLVGRTRIASYVTEWAARVDAKSWRAWTWTLLAPDPWITVERTRQLRDIVLWTRNRVWPATFPDLRAAMDQFAWVVDDMLNAFNEHADLIDDERLFFHRFYKIKEWNPELYGSLLVEYEYKVDLLHDLVLEMTRAGNCLAAQVRSQLDAEFLIDSGLLGVERSPNQFYETEYSQPEYRPGEEYRGLDDFRRTRSIRDVHIGSEPIGR